MLVREPRIPQYRTPALQGLDDLVTLIARERESRRRTVYLHRPPQRLLRPRCHAVRLVQYHQLLSSLRQGDFLLREPLDAATHDIDTAFVGSVEFQDGFFVGGGAEQLACKAEDGGSFADAWHTGDDHVGHIAVFGDDLQALDRFHVADDVVEVDGAVLLDPTLVRDLSSGLGNDALLTKASRRPPKSHWQLLYGFDSR